MDRENTLTVSGCNIERSGIWDPCTDFNGDTLGQSTLIVTAIIPDKELINLLKLSIKSRILRTTDALS